ncbi:MULTISPECIES: winged helix-turn-helix domain-containing protein [Microbacterium]|uniref:Helix-turn-helix domain-containing protein n=1 Tax=Microbacterium profundi TaxID=450380 RepID=A0ABV3LCQ6_9MICO|nr:MULTISPECIES: helix-turn-helix domain-containing protein [Microbacterium]MCE7480569.1 helix-turn-helix domain-containing protein [Microbacterium profundi]
MEEIRAITAVHHPVRRRIVDYLGLYGASQVTTLARALDQQVGSISHHLRMLERAGIVERADAPNADKRTSWWQPTRRSFTWSADDFEDSPSNALLAREAERTNISTQLQRLKSWHGGKQRRPEPEWSRAAFSTDALAWASAAELTQLSEALRDTIDAWRTAIDREDGAERRPVFVFAHGFPTTP